jgi:hypothetical protein
MALLSIIWWRPGAAGSRFGDSLCESGRERRFRRRLAGSHAVLFMADGESRRPCSRARARLGHSSERHFANAAARQFSSSSDDRVVEHG